MARDYAVMGYVAHNAIIVTSFSDTLIASAIHKAKQLQLSTSEPVPGTVNSYQTFLVAPDGSKEGWKESDDGNRRRTLFKLWLRGQRYEDGSSPFEWLEIQYGSDEDDAMVVDHEWKH